MYQHLILILSIFPAYAGVILDIVHLYEKVIYIPRIRGGDPSGWIPPTTAK